MHTPDQNIKHNTNIPGWNGREILDVIANYAMAVPEDGNILELGALFGRSTYSLGHNKPASVKLYTIDFWPTIDLSVHKEVWIHDSKIGPTESKLLQDAIVRGEVADSLPGHAFYKLWDTYTSGIENKFGIRGNTMMPTDKFPMFNFIFHDASHEYDGVYKDLVHWFPKLLPDGVIIIDDYEATQFPGVIRAVDQFAEEHDLVKEMVTHRNILLRRKV